MEALVSYPGGVQRCWLCMQRENWEIQSPAGAERKDGCEGNHDVSQECTDSKEEG